MQLVVRLKTPCAGGIGGTISELRDHRMAEGCMRRLKLEGGVNRISTEARISARGFGAACDTGA